MTSIIDADSLLVIDVGTVTTRAMLFDVVDTRYRFLGKGEAPTTAGVPFNNISEGVRQALERLQEITARVLVGADEQVIIPRAEDGSGVDALAAVLSVGEPLKIILVGLLEDVSLESARRLARTTYSKVLDAISLNDRRKPDARIDAIMRIQPDLIVVAGGTESGASQSVLKLLDAVGLACYLMPPAQRPELLFAGNQTLQGDIQNALGEMVPLHFAPNVRPTLEVEQIDPAQVQLGKICTQIRARQLPGVEDLNRQTKGNLLPASAAFGRVIRFLSQAYVTKKGVMGVDVGASATTIAAAFQGELVLGTYPQFGMGRQLASLLEHVSLNDIMRWVVMDVPPTYVHEYIMNKALYPSSIPATLDDLAVEQAIARVMMQSSVKLLSPSFPANIPTSGDGLLPWVEPIVATGSVLVQAPSLGHSALMLLDGLQPTGATTLALDQNHIIPALGVAAAINPTLVSQVIDSTSLLFLGTVISPVGNARPGTPILRLKMIYENGHEASLEVKQGTLEVLPLPVGQKARLQLSPMHRYEVGMGAPGRGGGLTVHGGLLGVVIDARGRPVALPDDPGRRYELFKKWLWTLGG